MESWLPVSLLSRPAALLWKVRTCSFVFVNVQCFVFYGKYHVEIKTQVNMAGCFIVEGEKLFICVCQCLSVFYGKCHVEIKTQVNTAGCFIVEGENQVVSVFSV